jgi:hypothetical protein
MPRTPIDAANDDYAGEEVVRPATTTRDRYCLRRMSAVDYGHLPVVELVFGPIRQDEQRADRRRAQREAGKRRAGAATVRFGGSMPSASRSCGPGGQQVITASASPR